MITNYEALCGFELYVCTLLVGWLTCIRYRTNSVVSTLPGLLEEVLHYEDDDTRYV